MTDRQIRASDQERESVVDVLRDAFTEGRLTSDELEERTTSAYTAKTWAQLGELTSDLPVTPPLGASLNRQPQIHPPQRPRRSHRYDGLLSALLVWIVISAASGEPSLAAALSFVFICMLACRIATGGADDRELRLTC
jgi:Domain of unknown function (DUF1707)